MSDLPNQERMEIPLLCSLLRRHGEITFSVEGRDIEEELADLYELSPEQRTEMLTSPRARRWRNHIQWVRAKLKDKGELEDAGRDVWRVSDRGRQRVRNFLITSLSRLSADEMINVVQSARNFNKHLLHWIAWEE